MGHAYKAGCSVLGSGGCETMGGGVGRAGTAPSSHMKVPQKLQHIWRSWRGNQRNYMPLPLGACASQQLAVLLTRTLRDWKKSHEDG